MYGDSGRRRVRQVFPCSPFIRNSELLTFVTNGVPLAKADIFRFKED
jgi:hypothetical protein